MMRERTLWLRVLLLVCLGLAMTWLASCSQSLAAVEEDLPLEKRVCRLYSSGIRPMAGGQPKKAFYGLTPEQYVDVVAEMGTEVWGALDVTYKGVYFPSKMVPVTKEVPMDHLPRVVKRAHEHNIIVQGAQQLSDMENQDVDGKMKDWAIVPLGGGKPNPQWQSFAKPGFRKWMGEHMAEHIRLADLDGFWFDGTPFAQRTGWPWPAGCLSGEGRADFKAKTGHDAPEKEDWQSQAFREWVKWRYDTTVDFMSAVTARANQEKPDLAVAMVYSMRSGQWHPGLPMRRLHDRNWYPAIHGPESSLVDKLGRALSPRCEMWFWAQWHIPQVVHGEGAYFDPDRTIASGLRALAHGVYPSAGGWAADIELWKDSLKLAFDEYKKRRDYIGGESVKYAAMLISQQTRDYRRQPGFFWLSMEGISEMHNAEHLLTDVIFDESVTAEGLADYPVVILANVTCLSDAQCDVIRQYVRNGGTVVATMETSLYDEWGNKRDNFGLADLFGVNYQETGGNTSQILVPQTADLKQQFGRFVSFLSQFVSFTRAEGSDAEVLFTKSPRGNLNGLSVKFEEYDSDVPAIVRRRIGKGTAYYVGAELGQGYIGHRLPQVARLLAALERNSATPPLEFDAPLALETTAFRRGPKRIIVHLVNCTAFSFRKMAPLANIGITVNEGTLKRATSPITGTKFPVKGNRVTVPAVGYGDVIVLDLK